MNKNAIPTLFSLKSTCCACGACANACPSTAIAMKEDEYGFLFPVIDDELCIRCGKCNKVCSFQNTTVKNNPIATFASVAKNEDLVKKSASGGIFAALAEEFIESNGVVIGAELQSDFSVHHSAINKQEYIYKLQGSKYVQSSTERIFSETKIYLEANIPVLFSGTPCQIAGLYGFLDGTHKKLLTIDIICHGVPNNKMFQEYINDLEKRNGSKITAFAFRDKSIGWGINGRATIGKTTFKIWQSTSSYLYFFSQGWIYRECCYNCKYACSHHPADITLGDYWGIEKQHPEFLGKGKWDEEKGISVVIANTKKGLEYLKKSQRSINLRESSFEKAAEGNAQLNRPSSYGKRNEILDIYKNGGYATLEKYYKKKIGLRYYSSQIKAIIPRVLKRLIKGRR